jgi:hypothetical protein
MSAPENDRCVPREVWKARVRAANNSLYVRVIGIPYHIQIEPHPDETRVDHVWMDVQIPPCGRLRLSVNTLSKLNERAGFNPRMRLGIVASTYEERPEPLIETAPPLDYRLIEQSTPVDYVTYDHDPLEALLLAKGQRAIRIEAWGELYIHMHLGVHQLHSRRASCAVSQDFLGRDGALKLYYPDKTAELLLFKFCGQE